METLATPIRKREVYDYTPKTTDEIYLLLKDILHLTFINIEETNKALLDMTIELAQEYFSNPEAFERAVKNTL